MSDDRTDAGIPRRNRRPPVPRDFDAAKAEGREATDARNDKLRRKNLSRLARARNLELRHSSYGYSLIDAARNRIDDRSDMSLNDVKSYLDGGG